MSYLVGNITRMWCESENCGKEFSAKQYHDANKCCPFCGSDDGFSWDAENVEEIFDDE